MAFAGIPLAALDFYEDLEDDNSKTFWQAHKATYDEQVKAPLTALCDELAATFGGYKLFRPYRDVRFSKDKTPYKTHQGVWFDESRTYVEVNAAGLRVAAGYWRTTSPQVQRLRRGIGDDVAGPALERAVAKVRRAGHQLHGEQLARVPAGFDRDHPRGELLRYKTLTAGSHLGTPDWLTTPDARTHIAATLRAMAPLVTWLDTHVGED